MARRALGKILAELTGEKVDRKLGKKVNLTGQGYNDYLTYIPATRPQFSPWLDMSMKDMYNMKYKQTNSGVAKEINAFNDVMDEFNNNNYKFKFNDKEYILAEKGMASPYIAEEWGVPGGVLKTDFDFKLASLDSTEVVDIGKALTEMGDGDADIIKFMQESKIQITGQISPEKYTEYNKEYYENLRYGRHTNMSSFDIQKSIYERTPEQIEFDKAWEEHLKQEEAKSREPFRQRAEERKVQERYRAERQAELEAVFNGTTVEPEVTTNTNPGKTAREARAEAVQRRQAKQAAQDAVKQKEAVRNSKIDGVVDDLFDVNSNSYEAHSALKAMNKDGFFDSQEDFQTAKARLTAKYDAKPTRASIPRPGVTKEALERTEGYAIKTVKPGLEFKINSNAKGELSGIGSMRGGIAGEFADATVGNPYFKQVFSGRNLGAVLNLGFAINDFNEARDAGDGVVKAAAKAGAQFVAGEMLGGWMFPVMLAKQVPTMAISAIEGTQKITRQMNSTGRIQTFGQAEFRDTQQLATMRQAGMELAKMSQYNLQQSMMGNEAQYMHKL